MFLKQHKTSISFELNMRNKFVVPLDQKVAHKSHNYLVPHLCLNYYPNLSYTVLRDPTPSLENTSMYHD